ncbi:MAG: hypothetical protein Q8L84_13450 [Hyphomonas sp.]|nr:hypothetical protein [Hyphomonas sp.]
MKTQTVCIVLAIAVLTSCGVPESEHARVISENESLKVEIDELKNGEPRLIAVIKKSIEAKNYSEAKSAIERLMANHPSSDFIPEAERISAEINSLEQAAALAAKEEAAEKERQKNISNTGIWQVSNYVDEFGEATDSKLIRNTELIQGSFSNSATQDSDLTVILLIDSANEVHFVLYEYAGNNPVKAYSPDKYIAQMRDGRGNRERPVATNYGDRLSFGPEHSGIIFRALLNGGEIKFHIYEEETPTRKYDFTIKNADHFGNAVLQLDQ